MSYLDVLTEIVQDEANFQHIGVSDEQIDPVEALIRKPFPQEYREYLHMCNGGDFFDSAFTLFSVYDSSNIFITPAVNLGAYNMPGFAASLSIPESYIIIGVYNFGDFICLDSRSGKVIQWDVANDEAYLTYADLLDFLTQAKADYLQA